MPVMTASFAAALLAAAAIWNATPLAQAPAAPYRILITNDDGVRAPGILAVAQALESLGEVTIVAPAENQSGKGHSITISDPIYVDTVSLPGGLRAYAAAATPASCVKVALGALMPARPDLVVSGINRGYNLGMVTYVSGTDGAAREAALQGIPAIAASLASEAHPGYGPAAEMVRRVAELVKARGLDRGVFLNVNVPAGTIEALEEKGLMMARQSAQSGAERFEEQTSPTGRRYFWSVWHEPTGGPEGTDVWAVEHGYVAITPLHAGEFDQATFDRWKGIK
jgi:5'-nucleotidase